MKGLIGRKVGMTQVFLEDGELIPVTVVEVLPNVVLQKKTEEIDGYDAIQVGIVDKKANRVNKPEQGHAEKAGTSVKKFIREFRDFPEEVEVGQEITADLFEVGERVDVQGRSRGKGYMGAIYRNNQAIGPKAHGSGSHRTPGSFAVAGIGVSEIKPGKISAGQEGYKMRTNQNLEVVKVDVEKNYILIKGNVPGPKRGLVTIKSTVKNVKKSVAGPLLDRSVEQEG